MLEPKEKNVAKAQGNIDVYYATPGVWAEKKLLELQGRREVFDYSKGPEPELSATERLTSPTFIGRR